VQTGSGVLLLSTTTSTLPDMLLPVLICIQNSSRIYLPFDIFLHPSSDIILFLPQPTRTAMPDTRSNESVLSVNMLIKA